MAGPGLRSQFVNFELWRRICDKLERQVKNQPLADDPGGTGKRTEWVNGPVALSAFTQP